MFARTKKNLPTKPTEYPPGTFVESDLGYFYITSPSKRYFIITKRVLDSWSPPRVAKTTEEALKNYRVASRMKFRNGSLINNMADGRLYLIVEGLKCPVVSPDVMPRIGASQRDVILVSKDEAGLHKLGEEIT